MVVYVTWQLGVRDVSPHPEISVANAYHYDIIMIMICYNMGGNVPHEINGTLSFA